MRKHCRLPNTTLLIKYTRCSTSVTVSQQDRIILISFRTFEKMASELICVRRAFPLISQCCPYSCAVRSSRAQSHFREDLWDRVIVIWPEISSDSQALDSVTPAAAVPLYPASTYPLTQASPMPAEAGGAFLFSSMVWLISSVKTGGLGLLPWETRSLLLEATAAKWY